MSRDPSEAVPVCTEQELPAGAVRVVTVGKDEVLVCRTPSGDVLAVSNRCPHQGARMSDGVISGTVTAVAPGVYSYAREGEIVRCPWHQYEFDLRDGCSLFKERRNRLRTYQVEARNGHIYVSR